ncbi:MAG: MBL fold metallo-hydrolase [Rhodospirillales bacterium]|nr:MBL fold metallo-hydrolase [Rhodospirillales bacterium]
MRSIRPDLIAKKLMLAGCASFLLGFSGSAQAQSQDYSKVEISSQDLGGGVHALFGAGGNMGVSAGPDGVFLVDDQFAPLTDKINAAIAKISDQPVRFLINTHWHFDHTGGNENFGKQGAIIVAHDNVRKLMSEAQLISFFKMDVPAAAKDALPVITFSDTTTFHLNGDTVVVSHLPPGHTNGDSIVHFQKANVLHTGDLFFNGIYPFIDVDHGGSIDGLIADADVILQRINAQTRIIPGHGPLADRAALVAYRDMLTVARDQVMAQISEGKTREQVVAGKPTASLDGQWGNGFLNGDAFAGLVFDSLK